MRRAWGRNQLPALLAPLFALATALLVALACSDSAERVPPGYTPPARPDVFVVLIDTLRADALATFNPAMPIGDAVAGLAADGIVFEQLRSSSSWTRSSVASLFTGKTVGGHGVFNRRDQLSDRHETLATILSSRGYHTHAWSTNPNILGIWGFGRGFDAFSDLPDVGRELGAMEGREVVDRVIADIRRQPQGPLFHYIHLSDPHEPYAPGDADLSAVEGAREALRANFPGDLRIPHIREMFEDVYPRYLAEVRDVDRALEGFLAFLRETGRYDDALILLVADHGEEFADHGAEKHGRTLFEEVLRVPGVLKLPGNRHAGRRLGEAVEFYDLLPTLLSALGVDWEGPTQGRDVMPWLDAAPTSEAPPGFYALTLDGTRISSVRFGRHKLIYNHRSERAFLYDLEADPGERHDIAPESPEVAAQLKALLDRAQEVHASGWHIRGCGCAVATTLAFELHGHTSTRRGTSLEDADRIVGDEGGEMTEILMSLDPTRAARQGQNAQATVAPDSDEIVLAEAADTTLSGRAGASLEVALANGEIESRQEPLRLTDLIERADIDPSERVVCDPTGRIFWQAGAGKAACRPHLRVWHVRPADTVASEDVDPDIRERLRALGYSW